MNSIFASMLKIGKINDFINISDIKTKEDVDHYGNLNYLVKTVGDFKNTYPSISDEIINHLYYTKEPIDSIIYMDLSKMLLFSTRIYITDDGFNCLSMPHEGRYLSIEDTINKLIETALNLISKQQYYMYFSCYVPEKYVLELFSLTYHQMPSYLIYETFIDLYTEMDFGSSHIPKEILSDIISSKSEIQKHKTLEKLASFPEEITIYRGFGNRSNQEGFSYTLKKNIAAIFAFSYEDCHFYLSALESGISINPPKIIEAKISKKDIIEYLDGREEEEILCFPQKVQVISTYTYPYLPDIDNYDYIMKLHMDIKSVLHSLFPDIHTNDNLKSDHNTAHMERVLFWVLYLSYKYENKIRKDDLVPLYIAAYYHDIGRTHDYEDNRHGLESYKMLSKAHSLGKADHLIHALMKYHCEEDDIIKNSGAFSRKEKLLIEILKDADALDRVRFGFKEIDIDYLRLNESEPLLLAAYQLPQIIK